MLLKLNSSQSFMLFFWFSLTMNEDITHSARNMGKVADSWECLVTMEKHFQNKIVVVSIWNWTDFCFGTFRSTLIRNKNVTHLEGN